MKILQKKVSDFCEKYNLKSSVEYRFLDLISELGEVSKELLIMSDYGKTELKFREEFKHEMGDVLYSLITVANSFDVDLEESLDYVLKKYEKRLAK